MVGLDQHEVGAMAVSQLLRRSGFEVIYLGPFNSAESLATAAIEEDADIVGVSVHSWEFEAHLDALVRRCHEAGVAVAVGGSVLTETDRADLARRGVDAVFLAYASDEEIVSALDHLVRRGERPSAGGEGDTRPALAGRSIVVTGAGRGLGQAYVDLLVALGARVVAGDLDGDALADAAAARLRMDPDSPGRVESVVADVTSAQGIDALVGTALERFGRLDGVVSNAGLLRSGPIVRLSVDDIDTVLAVHVRGTVLLARAAGSWWRSEHKAGRGIGGAFVTTTSSAGLYGFRAEAIYSAAKAAVAAFTLVAADELARFGVTANAVAPLARTRLTSWMGDVGTGPDDDPLAPGHVAPLVAWLVGPDAVDVTGRVFEVGGGHLSVASGWTPGPEVPLTARTTHAEVGTIVHHLLAAAAPPTPIVVPTLP
jgi:methylmalonyl-CoA mutase cobalamin-binding domain/chain